MWFDKKRPAEVVAPSRGQFVALRLMIFLGLAGMGLFLWAILQEEHIGYPPLYYILMFSMIFICGQVAYEWYHYFNISVPAQPELKQGFKVDVFTTFCPGEPYEMITETLEAIQRIDYPHTAYLCDEANDPALKAECKRLGVVHVTRDNRIDAKAGNINNALLHAKGDICLVLDPDHVPAPDFFDHVLPHFQDPQIGFVQVVQAYKNIKDGIIAKGAAQQTFQFYGPMMMTMSSYGTAQAIGANCTFRRAALDSIGGHAAGLAEDMNTSMKLHARGWRSVYVPKVLTRGLVPNTLSAYYKQQLKWSRGVFELLITTYLQNFRQFTLRQKLHYGLLPWHYFTGAIFLINFLIPVISLLSGYMPMKINLSYFVLAGTLFFASTIIIRHYVQRWVMEEEERGFHLVGGLLLIGTWWIHLLGFIFTILRRKVPYNPTPKDGKEENTFGLNIPNMVLGALSIVAIIYGLYKDFNPYTLVMAGFAGLNTLFVAIMLWMSYQQQFHRFRKTSSAAERVYTGVKSVKTTLWIFRHNVYGALRFAALPFLLFLVAGLYYYGRTNDLTKIESNRKPDLAISKYTGIFLPANRHGEADLAAITSWSVTNGMQPGIISTYLAWKPLDKSPFPAQLLESIYDLDAYPLVTWEPWLDQFSHVVDSSLTFMQRIPEGHYDTYLAEMAVHFRQLRKPLFLRFAHEPDNPAYPWYSAQPSAPDDYVKAWRYVHRFMMEAGATNLIWVFNPWKAAGAEDYFPGAFYTDWLGVTALNYASAAGKGNWNSFESIYAPFTRSLVFKQGLPVMLAEFGTLDGAGDARAWFTEASAKLREEYREVKACVLFANGYDSNVPEGNATGLLDWFLHAEGFKAFRGFQENFIAPQVTVSGELSPPSGTILSRGGEGEANPAKELTNLGDFQGNFLTDQVYERSGVNWRENLNEDILSFYQQIEGVNYLKGLDWQSSLFPLFKRTVLEDLGTMKGLRLNWIKRYGPGVYDRNILDGAEDQNINVMYAFWAESDMDHLSDKVRLEVAKNTILKAVKEHRTENAIKAWHIGNAVWSRLGEHYDKPQLSYQQEEWLYWLSGVVRDMKKIDDSRPVSIELNYGPYLKEIAVAIAQRIPEVDAIGVNIDVGATSIDDLMTTLGQIPLASFVNKLPAIKPGGYDQLQTGWFSTSWQDDVYSNHVTFDGLLDHQGRKKPGYRNLEQRLGNTTDVQLPEIAILPPAELTYPGQRLIYHAILGSNGRWTLAGFDRGGLEYTWQLVKIDAFGNALAMRRQQGDVAVDIAIPPDPHLYRLRLIAAKEGYSTSSEIPLSTPIYTGPGLRERSREEIDYLFRESKKR